MTPAPATVAQLGEFDTIIDVRSPAEFAQDRIPGALGMPVLDNEERAQVGTLYTQVSPFEARKVGGALVACNIARHLQQSLADKPKRWRPLIYCWRGGQRSGAFVTWLRMVGWDARQLGGGYVTWRRHVVAQLASLPTQLDFRVVAGATGSAKTRLLHALRAAGAQVLDLEALAGHKGSVLGAVPGVAQPSQKAFETALSQQLTQLDVQRPVFVEAESRKIGRIHLPNQLIERMRASRCVAIEAAPSARIAFLLRDYAYLADDRPALQASLGHLRGLHSNDTLTRWLDWAAQGYLEPLFTELITQHYDPSYRRSQRASFAWFEGAQRVELDALDAPAIEAAARQVLAAS